jgi:hypothetical protein
MQWTAVVTFLSLFLLLVSLAGDAVMVEDNTNQKIKAKQTAIFDSLWVEGSTARYGVRVNVNILFFATLNHLNSAIKRTF